jgi:hypothetical protein
VSDDFVFTRTVPGGVRALLAQFDFKPLAHHIPAACPKAGEDALILADPPSPGAHHVTVSVYDRHGRRRLRLLVEHGQGYLRRAGQEVPAAGLRAVTAWVRGENDEMREIDLGAEWLVLPPCR